MPDDNRITVVVAALAPVVGRGVAEILREDGRFHIVAMNQVPRVLSDAIQRLAPAVAILPEETPIQSVRNLRTLAPGTGLFMLAHRPARDYGLRILAAGASISGYTTPSAALTDAIADTAHGAQVFVSHAQRIERRVPADTRLLTKRERQVLEQLAEGRTNPEIARQLQISVETVRTHVSTIFRKLSVTSRRQLLGMRLAKLDATVEN